MLRNSNRFHRFWRSIALFLVGLIALALLTLICFRLNANSTTVALLFLIIIVLVSLKGHLIPSALVAIIGYVCLDYFFTAPLFTLGMNQTLDFVAPISYLITAVVITRLIANVRRSNEDRKAAEVALRKTQAELAHVTRVMTMGELAASIAHEINQPLAAVVTNGGACQRWLSGDQPNLDEAREAARRIVRDGHRAGEVITRIRSLLKKTETEKTSVDINEIIEEVAALTGDEAKRNNIAVQVELSEDVPPAAGDRVQLQQVILNLMMNGIEAMVSVSDRRRQLVVRSARLDSNKIIVTVQDSGTGLNAESLEKIFDAFYTTKANGLGMGLAISKSIVEDLGGQLWATPNEALGATFQFTILQYDKKH